MLQIARLEPESSGLLDRLLDVFHQETYVLPQLSGTQTVLTQAREIIYISATLNCLGSLLRSRYSIYNKIISAILNFNPFKKASGSMTPKDKILVKSVEKTTRILLNNMIKRYIQE